LHLVGILLPHTRTGVKVNNEYTEEFKGESGVKQGDPLSATLFSVVDVWMI